MLQRIDGVAETDRLWRNLLSSQPLAFSIAGHLRAHPEAAAQVFSTLLGRRVLRLADLIGEGEDHRLQGIEAEWFPPAALHTRDRSGFDIASLLELEDGRHLLLTIEVKYVDSFAPKKLDVERYGDVLQEARMDGATAESLVSAGGSQFLRSVLLTDSVRRKGIAGGTTSLIDEACAVGRDDDASARRVVDQFAGAGLPVTTAYWAHSEFCDAAAAVPYLTEWAESLRRRYVLPN